MATVQKEKEFSKDDAVVYPLQGVGVIRGVQERTFKGKKTKYYDIYMKASDMTIMIPTSKLAELGIRPIISKRKGEMVLEKIETEEPYTFSSDWKIRYQNSLEQIRDGTLLESAKILKALYLRSKTKDLPIMERKLYDSSLQALISELALATKKPETSIREILFAKFEVPPPTDPPPTDPSPHPAPASSVPPPASSGPAPASSGPPPAASD